MMDIIQEYVFNAEFLKGLGTLALAKGLVGIYQLQYKKIKELQKKVEELEKEE